MDGINKEAWERWRGGERGAENNNSENRVAFITANDLLAPSYHR